VKRSGLPLGPILALVAVATIAVGAGLYLGGNETLGAVLAVLGLLDLATIPLVMRAVGRRSGTGAPGGSDSPASTDAAPKQPDRDHNPYARED